MLRWIITFICITFAHSVCSVSHDDLWNCAFKSSCLNAYQLHALASRNKQKQYQRPFILAMEGPKYRRLFRDCDTNKDGCIDKNDLDHAGPECQRSCMWRTTMKDLLCQGVSTNRA